MFVVCLTVVVFMVLLLNISFVVLLERKVMAYSQSRKGPNSSTPGGWGQSFLDFLKSMNKKKKELMNTQNKVTSPAFFILGCIIVFMSLLLVSWVMSIHVKNWLLLFFVLAALAGFCITMIGWGSSNKFSLLAVVRVCMTSLCNDSILMCIFIILGAVVGSYGIFSFFNNNWCVVLLVPLCYLIWFFFCSAESSRSPHDYVEGESETVSGVNLEFIHSSFLLLYVYEYMMVFVISFMTGVFFFGGNGLSFYICLIHLIFFLLARACFPRVRFDVYLCVVWNYLIITLIIHCFISIYK